MGLLLNNDTLQVNFIEDSVKIIIHGPFVPGSAVLILIDSTRTLQVKNTIPQYQYYSTVLIR